MSIARQAIDDASKGRLAEGELQPRLFRAGLVIHGDEAWLLDLGKGRWCRYDGMDLQLESFDEPVGTS